MRLQTITEGYVVQKRINEALKLGNDLCLLIETTTFILFSKEIKNALEDYDYDEIEKHIKAVAYLRENKKHKCWELESMYATDGYGPTMVVIIAEWTGKKGLIPDVRASKVSDEAKAMFKEFMPGGKGAEYLEAEAIEGSHKDDFLNQKFRAKVKTGYKRMQTATGQIVFPDPYNEKKDMLLEVGDAFLTNKMRQMYEANEDIDYKDIDFAEDLHPKEKTVYYHPSSEKIDFSPETYIAIVTKKFDGDEHRQAHIQIQSDLQKQGYALLLFKAFIHLYGPVEFWKGRITNPNMLKVIEKMKQDSWFSVSDEDDYYLIEEA